MSGCPFGGQPGTGAQPDAEAPVSAAGDAPASRLSRRGLLSLAGVGGAGAVAGIATGLLGHDALAAVAAPPKVAGDVVPFHGPVQAGITTAAQDRLHMAAFDVVTEDRAALIQLLKDWTAAAEAMTQGRETGATGAVDGPYDAPPEDTGEALGLSAGKLTVTFGFGASLFEKDGKARFGLEGRRPDALIDLPHFPGDDLQDNRSGGDIIVQACCRRPAGCGPRDPQPGPDRLRQGPGPLVPAGLRPHFLDVAEPADPPQPLRLQGRHEQPQGRGHRAAE